MSLTRAQWEEMWDAVKRIEDTYDEGYPPPHSGYRRIVKKSIEEIKSLIQSVVGQQE